MKIAIIAATLYASLFSIVVFNFAGARTTHLTLERERFRAEASLWQRVDESSARIHTLFLRAHVEDYTRTRENQIRLVSSSVLQPSGLMTTATSSACNPRITPCF